MKKTKLAVFDIDGTIFRKNLHFEIINELVYLGIFDPQIRSELTNSYGNWLDHEGTYDEYRNKLVKLYEKYIKGCKQEDVLNASKEVANFHCKRIYIFAKELIERLSKDHIMLVISGSPIEIVREYAKLFKFDAFYGSVYEIDNNKCYTGKTVFEPTVNKGAVVKQFVAENNISLKYSIGIGDTESDVTFLELMEHAIAFNPNLNLKKVAQKKGWRIVVEKKDVVYEIS